MEFYFVEGENYVKNKRSPSAQSKKSRPSKIQTYSRPDRHSCLRNLSRTRLYSRRPHARLPLLRKRATPPIHKISLQIQSNHLRPPTPSSPRSRPPAPRSQTSYSPSPTGRATPAILFNASGITFYPPHPRFTLITST